MCFDEIDLLLMLLDHGVLYLQRCLKFCYFYLINLLPHWKLFYFTFYLSCDFLFIVHQFVLLLNHIKFICRWTSVNFLLRARVPIRDIIDIGYVDWRLTNIEQLSLIPLWISISNWALLSCSVRVDLLRKTSVPHLFYIFYSNITILIW